MIVVWALWSVFVWTLSFVWMALLIVLSLPFLLFVPFARIQAGFPMGMMGLIPYLTLSRIRLTYHPKYDKTRPYVYVVNHTSMMDAHLICRIIPQVISGMMNEAHLWVPVYGWIMRMANAIPVPRDATKRAAKLAELVKERASRNISIVTFPEAHRTLDGKIRDFRRGVFFMARDGGLPIVPIAIRGLYDVFPKGTWIMRPGTISVYVGPPIDTAGLTDEQVNRLVGKCREWIVRYVEQGETPADEMLALEAA